MDRSLIYQKKKKRKQLYKDMWNLKLIWYKYKDNIFLMNITHLKC